MMAGRGSGLFCANIRLIWITLVALALLLPSAVAVQDDIAFKKPQQRRPSGCRFNDARCLALQSEVCDPWNVTATDKCTYVQDNEYCMEDVGRIHYLALFYCNNSAMMVAAGVGWMLLLFLIMTITAEVFLCPAIEYLASWMGLAPDIAGVTLFAFASGAPDLFTQVAALASGDHVDVELAVSATFGGGLFIICVVFATVVLADGGGLMVPDRRAFIRDASAYLVASAATLGLLCMGRLTALDGGLLVAGYFVYLGICLSTRSTAGAAGSSGYRLAPSNGKLPPLSSASIPHAHAHANAPFGESWREEGGMGPDGEDTELEMIPFTLPVENAADSPAHGSRRGSMGGVPALSTVSNPLAPARRQGSFEFPAAQETLPSPGFHPRSAGSSPSGGATSFAGWPNVEQQQLQTYQQQQFQQQPLPPPPPHAGLELLPLSSNGGMPSPGAVTAALALSVPPLFTSRPSLTLREHAAASVHAWWQELPSTLAECLHLHGKTGWRRFVTYCTAPLVLFMHATMPALHTGTFTMAYATLMAVCAPPFFLVFASLTPNRLGGGTFSTVWLTSSLVIFTMAFGVQPLGYFTGSGFFLPTTPSIAGLTTHATGTPTPSVDGSAVGPSPTGQRPRRCLLLAFMAFFQCIMWLNATAEELVLLFEAVGRIWNVRRDILGATVLAWGETVPDLVAVLSLSRAGQGTMAVAACFGGPVFNLLVSMGGPIMVAGARTGSMQYQMTSGVVVLVVTTAVVLVGLLAFVPSRCDWRLGRRLGWMLLSLYAVSQVVFLMFEGIVL